MLKKTGSFLIDLLSNLFNMSRLRVCRFEPTCSVFAKGALMKHPPHKALYMIIGRLFRCRPFGPFGYDPVPHDAKNM